MTQEEYIAGINSELHDLQALQNILLKLLTTKITDHGVKELADEYDELRNVFADKY